MTVNLEAKKMIKIFIIGFLISVLFCSCNVQSSAGERALPEEPCHIMVYNGGGIVLDMENATISARTVRNTRLVGNGENWLIYNVKGIDTKDNKKHSYEFCDSEALMLVWE